MLHNYFTNVLFKNGCYGYQNEFDPKWHFPMVFLCYFNADAIGIMIFGWISIVMCRENGKGAVFRDIWPPCYDNQAHILVHTDWFLFLNKTSKKKLIFGLKSQFIRQFKGHLTWKFIISSKHDNFDHFLTK